MIIHLMNRSLFVLLRTTNGQGNRKDEKEVFGRAEEDAPGKLKRRK